MKIQETNNLNLLKTIDEFFSLKENPIEKGLMKEAYNIHNFLLSSHIPWSISFISDPSYLKKVSKNLLNSINEKAEIYWQALAKLVLKDNERKFEEAIVKSVQLLTHYYKAPVGVSFNDLGLAIRYYPLVFSLYIIFIIGTFKRRTSLLKRISELYFSSEKIHISYSLFIIQNASKIFQTQHEEYPTTTWCAPIGSYIKILFDQKINPYIDDYFFNLNTYFYIGEFLLSLLPLVVNVPFPAIGEYLFTMTSVPVIQEFLFKEKEWLQKIFNKNLKTILQKFDETVKDIKVPVCFNIGFAIEASKSTFSRVNFKKKNY
jgi:hypothetical protein